jgi:hypothetical protein
LKSNSRDMPGGGMLKFRIDRYISMGAKCGIVKPATVLL